MRPHTFTSPTLAMVLYVCANCSLHHRQLDRAEACCQCRYCGQPGKANHWLICEDCERSQAAERAVAAFEAERSSPFMPDDGGPVYCESLMDPYSASLDEAVDQAYDQDVLAGAVFHPCKVERVRTPNLADLIAESWFDQYDSSDDMYDYLPTDLAAIQKRTEEAAPLVSHPIMDVQLDPSHALETMGVTR